MRNYINSFNRVKNTEINKKQKFTYQFNTEYVKSLINNDNDVNFSNYFKEIDDIENIVFLIQLNKDCIQKEEYLNNKITYLQYDCNYNKTKQCLNGILDKKEYSMKENIFFYVFRNNSYKICVYLLNKLKSSININSLYNIYNYNITHYALSVEANNSNKNIKLSEIKCKVIKILTSNFNIKLIRDKHGNTEFHKLLSHPCNKCLEILLNYSKNTINIADNNTIDAFYSNTDTYTIYHNIKNNNGYNPLQLSIYEGNYRAFIIFIKSLDFNLSINTLDKHNNNLFHLCAIGGNINILKELISINMYINLEINKRNKNNKSPLGLAISNNKLDIIKCLIMNRATITKENINKMSEFSDNKLYKFALSVYNKTTNHSKSNSASNINFNIDKSVNFININSNKVDDKINIENEDNKCILKKQLNNISNNTKNIAILDKNMTKYNSYKRKNSCSSVFKINDSNNIKFYNLSSIDNNNTLSPVATRKKNSENSKSILRNKNSTSESCLKLSKANTINQFDKKDNNYDYNINKENCYTNLNNNFTYNSIKKSDIVDNNILCSNIKDKISITTNFNNKIDNLYIKKTFSPDLKQKKISSNNKSSEDAVINLVTTNKSKTGNNFFNKNEYIENYNNILFYSGSAYVKKEIFNKHKNSYNLNSNNSNNSNNLAYLDINKMKSMNFNNTNKLSIDVDSDCENTENNALGNKYKLNIQRISSNNINEINTNSESISSNKELYFNKSVKISNKNNLKDNALKNLFNDNIESDINYNNIIDNKSPFQLYTKSNNKSIISRKKSENIASNNINTDKYNQINSFLIGNERNNYTNANLLNCGNSNFGISINNYYKEDLVKKYPNCLNKNNLNNKNLNLVNNKTIEKKESIYNISSTSIYKIKDENDTSKTSINDISFKLSSNAKTPNPTHNKSKIIDYNNFITSKNISNNLFDNNIDNKSKTNNIDYRNTVKTKHNIFDFNDFDIEEINKLNNNNLQTCLSSNNKAFDNNNINKNFKNLKLDAECSSTVNKHKISFNQKSQSTDCISSNISLLISNDNKLNIIDMFNYDLVKTFTVLQSSDIIKKEKIYSLDNVSEIYKGKYLGLDIAIKEYNLNKFESIDRQHFINEVNLLLNIRHPLIVSFIGISQPLDDNNKFQIITEYMNNKSLKYVLDDKKIHLSELQKLKFCSNIACALYYLHTREPPVLHRDIKSSNCLVSDDFKIKLCDLGLSRVYIGRIITQTKSNTYWMSPESLLENVYTQKSDVYSLGILFWEIMHRKTKPYEGISETCFLFESNLKELRPVIDESVNKDIKNLIENCWKFEENLRPTTKDIVEKLNLIIENYVDIENKNTQENKIEYNLNKEDALFEEVNETQYICDESRLETLVDFNCKKKSC